MNLHINNLIKSLNKLSFLHKLRTLGSVLRTFGGNINLSASHTWCFINSYFKPFCYRFEFFFSLSSCYLLLFWFAYFCLTLQSIHVPQSTSWQCYLHHVLVTGVCLHLLISCLMLLMLFFSSGPVRMIQFTFRRLEIPPEYNAIHLGKHLQWYGDSLNICIMFHNWQDITIFVCAFLHRYKYICIYLYLYMYIIWCLKLI